MMSRDAEIRPGVDRRTVVSGMLAVSLLPINGLPAGAAPADMAAAMKKVMGAAVPKMARVAIKLPELTENGNSAPIEIEVDSPMTDKDHVRAIHIFSEKNPMPHIVRFQLGPRAGRAHVRTNIRLADTQRITVVAEMSDGSFWAGHAESEVTAPACIDESRL